jgi:F0F1-type ATP synthase assembly protein I
MIVALPDPKQLARYATLAQVGLEMVAPIVVGWFLDGYFGWSPWAVIVGALVGLVGGVAHLVALSNRLNQEDLQPPDKTADQTPDKPPS